MLLSTFEIDSEITPVTDESSFFFFFEMAKETTTDRKLETEIRRRRKGKILVAAFARNFSENGAN